MEHQKLMTLFNVFLFSIISAVIFYIIYRSYNKDKKSTAKDIFNALYQIFGIASIVVGSMSLYGLIKNSN